MSYQGGESNSYQGGEANTYQGGQSNSYQGRNVIITPIPCSNLC
jgi:hypothetical protein